MSAEEEAWEKLEEEFWEAVDDALPKVPPRGIATLKKRFSDKAGRTELREYIIWWIRTAYRDPTIPELSAKIQAIDNELHDIRQPYSVHSMFVSQCWISSAEALTGNQDLVQMRMATKERLYWLERIQDRIDLEVRVARSIMEYLEHPMIAPPTHLDRKGLSHVIRDIQGPRGEDSLRQFVVGVRRDLGLPRKAIFELAKAARITMMRSDQFNDRFKDWKPDNTPAHLAPSLPAQAEPLFRRQKECDDERPARDEAWREKRLEQLEAEARKPRRRRMMIRFEPIGIREFCYPPLANPPDKRIEDDYDPEIHNSNDIERMKLKKLLNTRSGGK